MIVGQSLEFKAATRAKDQDSPVRRDALGEEH
jgi:hypothetical protein